MLSQLYDYWIPDLLNLKSVSHIEDKCGDRVWDSVFLECLRCHGVVAQYCRSVLSLSSMGCVCWVNGLHFAWKSQFRLPWSAGEIVPSSLVPFQFKGAQLPVYAHLYKADTSCIPSDSGLTSKKNKNGFWRVSVYNIYIEKGYISHQIFWKRTYGFASKKEIYRESVVIVVGVFMNKCGNKNLEFFREWAHIEYDKNKEKYKRHNHIYMVKLILHLCGKNIERCIL